MSEHFGNSGKEKPPFNRKIPPADPGSGKSSMCCDQLGVMERRRDKRHLVEEGQRNISGVRDVYGEGFAAVLTPRELIRNKVDTIIRLQLS